MITRIIEQKIATLKDKFPILIITGPRQSGKTTLTKKSFPHYHYTNLENLDERDFAEVDPRRFLNSYADQGLIIDEAQKVPALFSYLQGIADKSQEMGRFILTGSQNFLLMEKITQSLAGRAAVLNLLPFSCEELRDTEYGNKAIDDLLFTGMYPPVYDRNISPADFFGNYLVTYIERDVRLLKNIGDLNTFRKFIMLCAGRIGQLLNFSALANEAGIDAKTAKSWLTILESSYVVFQLTPYYQSFNKRIVKQSKLYFFDTGLAVNLLGLKQASQLTQFYMRGNLFENYIISETMKYFYNRGVKPDIFFWRDNVGKEVDLIINTGIDFSAIEIKSGETINEGLFSGLRDFGKIADLPPERRFLIHGGDLEQSRQEARVVSWKNLDRLLGEIAP